jgi:hypothetical protein
MEPGSDKIICMRTKTLFEAWWAHTRQILIMEIGSRPLPPHSGLQYIPQPADSGMNEHYPLKSW